MNKQAQSIVNSSATSPIKNLIGSVFIPVHDIEKARSWYCQVLGLQEANHPIMNGHLCPLTMQGSTGIILDTMPMWGGLEPEGAPPITTPALMLITDDLQASFNYMKELGVEIVNEIQDQQWFVVKDPDWNKLMICK
ncbi:VOC family protein [Paenibacillus sp. FSL F4-0236]|uniref:VOC family protein n=1 Tax=Paenibacillus sp. FSL F4-0236 TaxID=2954731 RepID=UPI0030F77B8E